MKRPAHIKTDREWIEHLIEQGEADSFAIHQLGREVERLKKELEVISKTER